MTATLSIDQGTSATKAVVVDEAGRVLALAERGLRPRYGADGSVEQDPGELLQSVLEAGREAVALSRARVETVALANQGETVLAWDPASGAPLSQLVVWQDRRADAVCARLAERRYEIEYRTGLALDPYFSAPKQAWIRENVTREGVVTTSDSWLIHHLSGEFVTDVATASRSLAFELDTGRWSAELLDAFGLGGEALPEIVPSDAIVGETAAFGRPMSLGGLIVDQQAALIAQGCLAMGEAKCTFGTGAFFLANLGDAPVRSHGRLATSVAWSVRGSTVYCGDGQVYTAASAVQWLERIGVIGGAADLDRVVGADPTEDSGGVLCVPAFAGLAAPWWRPDAAAVLSGMTLSTGPEQLASAVLRGIAANVAEIGGLLERSIGRDLTRLRVDGGLCRSRTLMQAVADLMQLEVEVYPSMHATPLGAAALARVAAGRADSLADAVVPWRPSEVFAPRWSDDRAAEFRSRWLSAAATAYGERRR